MAPRVPQSALGRALTRRRYNGTRRVTEGVLRSGEVPRFWVVGFVFLSLLCFACLGGVASWARAVGARTLRHGRGKGTVVGGQGEGPESLPQSPGRGRSHGRKLAPGLEGEGAGASAERNSAGARPAGMRSLEPREAPSLWVAPADLGSCGRLTQASANERGPPQRERTNAPFSIPPLSRLAPHEASPTAPPARGRLFTLELHHAAARAAEPGGCRGDCLRQARASDRLAHLTPFT